MGNKEAKRFHVGLQLTEQERKKLKMIAAELEVSSTALIQQFVLDLIDSDRNYKKYGAGPAHDWLFIQRQSGLGGRGKEGT